MATLLLSMEMICSLWVMIGVSAETGRLTEVVAGPGA